MKLFKFKSFINEVATPREELYPKHLIQHHGKEDPALYTWGEYFDEMQDGAMKSWHSDSAYNYSIEGDRNGYSWVRLDDGNWDRIQTKKYDNIIIDFYQRNRGEWKNEKTIVAYHRDEEIVVGAAQDEWNSILVTVFKEYRGIGIGDDLMDLYMHYYPHKGTGGVTNAGYNTLKRYHARRVRKYLQNGIYSDMVRKGEITIKRVKEIVNSIDKKRYIKSGTEFSKTYGGSKELMYYIDDNVVIIFDKSIKDAFQRIEPERFTKRLIKCFIYANQTKETDYENIYTAYAESEQFLKLGMEMLMSSGLKLSNYWIHKRFDEKTTKYMENIFNSDDYKITTDKHYEHDKIVKVIDLKERKYSYRQLKRDCDKWFATNDKYDEFKNHLQEFAEGIADIRE